MTFQHLFTPQKLSYAKGNRPAVDCILCAVAQENSQVTNLAVYRAGDFVISLNLYPYNPGHLLIFPTFHCLDIRELSPVQEQELHRLQRASLDILDKLYSPRGYNIGYNIGLPAGASIAHLHLHIVPRFGNETGFMDVISGTRVIVEDPATAREKIAQAFSSSSKQGNL